MLIALVLPAFALDLPTCAGFATPEAPGVLADDSCQSAPHIGSFDPVVEWQWQSSSATGYNHVMSTPMVGNLTDDNGDGRIDDDDVPDILFVGHSYYGWSASGYLTLLSGDGQGEHWTLLGIGGYPVIGGGGTAIGDIDSDGSPDICVAGASVGVICAEYDGALKWAAGSPQYYGAGYPVIGDMDGDGCAEVAIGAQIFDCTGATVGVGANGDSDLGIGAVSMMADIDSDGQLELVVGNSVYERDGSLLWTDGGSEGYPAVGDFDGDGLPEVVRTGDGYLRMTDTDGTPLWAVALTGGGRGGPPTVADFDGDDEPEIGVAASYYYIVYEADGSVLWTAPVNDTTSNVTGSSVFDFEGDGAAEVVYADEYSLFVFNGTTGAVLLREDRHDSGTWFEYPVIADIDGDGSSEIVLASNTYRTSGDWAGITIIGDANSSWVDSRPIWNQHSYHITNVNDDGSIPTSEVANWASWNNFRSAGLLTGPSDWLPDLAVLGAEGCTSDCTDSPRTTDIWIDVGNLGLLDGEAELRFFRYVDGAPVTVATDSVSLPSGGSQAFGPYTFSEADWGEGDLWVSVDPEGALTECDESNGTLNLGWWPYPEVDSDGDGHDPLECGGDDCDDTDPFVNPDAPEFPYDGVDNDCSEETVDDDLDGDGFAASEDCDDEDAARNPDAEDLPANGIDEDCDGLDALADDGQLDDTGLDGDPKDEGQCGCASGDPTPGLWLALAGLALARRRR